MTSGEGRITKLLQVWGRGDRAALDQLAPLVHAELRKLARFHMSHEAAGHTLQPTALINEAFLKFVDINEIDWKKPEALLRSGLANNAKNFDRLCAEKTLC